MAEYRETYEVRGAEADVAEWWREADRLADRHNVTLSEDFGNSELGDIIRAIKVLDRVSIAAGTLAGTRPYVHIQDRRFFDAIPGTARHTHVVDEDSSHDEYIVEYAGIKFSHWANYSHTEKSLQGVA